MNFDLDLQNSFESLSRRHFLGRTGVGFGALALSSMSSVKAKAAAAPSGTFGKAKRVIYLHMAGAPSQLDLFEYKPTLEKLNGKPCPQSLLEGKRFAFIRGVPTMLSSPFKFKRHGQTGTHVSSLLPHFSKLVDKITLIKSLQTDEFNHAPAQLFALTGKSQFGSPSMGSWMTYGLGNASENLPGFVVLLSGGKTPDAGKSLWGSGYLPSKNQGVEVRNSGDPVLYVSNPPGLDGVGRRKTLDALSSLNKMELQRYEDPEIDTRIAQYELAYRMQTAVPEVMDISKEPQKILDLYGAKPNYKAPSPRESGDPRTFYRGDDPTFANNCLLARRLIEQGVRFVQLFDWGWDHHGISAGESIDETLPIKAQQIDKAIHGLITDLEQRGLLDETLIVWGGEFGRTPMQQNAGSQAFIGRDHHPYAFTMWMAGAGVKAGLTYGETDEIGYYPVVDPMHIRDLQATVMHLAGLDPYLTSYSYQGLAQRLIGPDDSKAKVKHDLLTA
jgi:hypothetical protein